ncbi:SURF1 family protein [Luteimonas kalidii]|uniref:SURF1-like protein n=1 Tax=Luteimonas kalidii TaxID=3042025 RepID=A0ABT6JQ83_9GAMM|nr:SURF1 family protein [Luteimonas kalidii]MDH5832665.1 SURF1 family protein [Luteimonas kalidii]
MTPHPAPAPRRVRKFAFLALLAALFAMFCVLGTWQVQRLQWKRDLIARVDARVNAEPVAAPGRAAWGGIDRASAEYLRVSATGRFLPGRDTRVDALTAMGPGAWILSPLRTADGDVVLVNRGFVPADARDATPVPAGEVRVEGLLRLDEPRGRILRANVPAQDRWFSRDVQAIAAARDLGAVAPYFIDAAFDPAAAPWPRGGMTVVRFRDHHLQYALTWFALALMLAFAAWRVLSGPRLRRRVPHTDPPDAARSHAALAARPDRR